jgi:tetratricopeptide (TPR) repeat protein
MARLERKIVRLRDALLVTALCVSLPVLAVAQNEHSHPDPESLGTVKFNTSCDSAVAPQFNRAVALMHSFQFAPAIAAFHQILTADPTCSMADWGIALSDWGNPFAAAQKPAAQVDAGLKAIGDARALKPKTERERAYVEALAHLYTDVATIDQHHRATAYADAMQGVSLAYPEDVEASIFYALALAAAADPADKTYANQLKAGQILEALFVKYPNHPGLAHYIIHAYDVPALASRAVNAAQRYGAIAPSTPHALHMPSHTFTRVGDWQASIDTNLASAAAAHKANQPADELHASDYLEYAYLQTAQDQAAQQVVQQTAEAFARFDPKVMSGGAASGGAAYFSRAAVPARYALERKSWSDAAKLEPVTSPYPYTDAMTYLARGLGAAHLKDVDAARSAVASLEQIHDKLLAAKENYWADQVDIQRMEVAAWLKYAEGDSANALAVLRTAVEREDKTEKNAVTPGPLAPARELLGEMLFELKQYAAAQKEFTATLAKEPNRFWSLYGAGEAARLAGDPAASKQYSDKLKTVAVKADSPGRPAMVEVRKQN